jgi:hypothetical protein
VALGPIELGFRVLIFSEGGKPEDPEKKTQWQGREPTNNSTHMKYICTRAEDNENNDG